jgi:hypothetical protein
LVAFTEKNGTSTLWAIRSPAFTRTFRIGTCIGFRAFQGAQAVQDVRQGALRARHVHDGQDVLALHGRDQRARAKSWCRMGWKGARCQHPPAALRPWSGPSSANSIEKTSSPGS